MPPCLVFFALPEGWERFDLWEPSAEAAVAGRLEERLTQEGVGTSERTALIKAAADAVVQARQAGVLVWAIHLAAPDPARPATLTVGLHAIPQWSPASSPPASGVPGVPAPAVPGGATYIAPPSEPRPLELVFGDAAGFTREWRLRIEPPGPAASMFCAQAVVVNRPPRVVATVTVSAFEPADEDGLRSVAADVARSLRLAAPPQGTAAAGPDHGGGDTSNGVARNGPGG